MKQPKPVGLTRGLRIRQTDAERLLWLHLRDRQLEGIKFRRQQALGKYIVDFVSLEEKLVIEVDGGQHNESLIIEKDEQRTQWLNSRGYTVIRFWNSDVLENMEGVVYKIMETLENRSHPHLTSPVKSEGRIGYRTNQ